MKLEDLTLDVEQHIEINATAGKSIFRDAAHAGQRQRTAERRILAIDLEPKVGGRWYRDRGNGVGHLWGFVQVIKPPELLELSGPMFMSYPALNHLEAKVEKTASGSKVTYRHRAIGMIDPEHRKGVSTGWNHMLEQLKKACE